MTLEALRTFFPPIIRNTALQSYKMARWRISSRSATRGADRWNDFKSLSVQQQKNGAHTYRSFLNRADPTLSLPTLEAPRFVGQGFGDYNLNIYRAGELFGKRVFEKIYFSGSDSLRKTEWFHDVVLSLADRAIRTPPIVAKFKGKSLTALYFEFIELNEPAPPSSLLAKTIELQEATRRVTWAEMDPVICDFRQDSFYARHREALASILSQNGHKPSDVSGMEDFLQRSGAPRHFSHGDISIENVRTCGTLIDFDHCGYYPAGYDVGAVLRCSQTPASVSELDLLVKDKLAPNCWNNQMAILFFMAVFSSIGAVKRTIGQPNEIFILHLWDHILGNVDIRL